MVAETSDHVARLAIRVRRVVARGGTESSHRTVFCPLRTQSLLLDECKTCDRYQRVVTNSTDRESFLICSCLDAPRESFPSFHQQPELLAGITPEALGTPVASIMGRKVVCVRADVTVDELVLVLVEHGISGVPVVDEAGRPIGVVSSTDLLWADYDEVEARMEGSRDGEEDQGARPKGSLAVKEIMTSTAQSMPADTTLSQAIATMAQQGVHRLLIVDQNGAVVGNLSASDLLTWLAHNIGHVTPRRFPNTKVRTK